MARRRGRALARVRTVTRRAAPLVRRGASAAARQASEEKHRLVAVATAAGLGFLKKQNTALPHIEAIGVPATYGIALAMAARFTKSRMLDHAATGVLSVAAYEWAKTPSRDGANASTQGDDLVI